MRAGIVVMLHISIHALREEGDLSRMAQNLQQIKFLSTPSARRATHVRAGIVVMLHISIHALREEGDLSRMAQNLQQIKFLSTPSARRATIRDSGRIYNIKISIHALREEGDSRSGTAKRIHFIISIHALREEGDEEPVEVPDISKIFLSTPSARRATNRKAPEIPNRKISIHALREEGDPPLAHRAQATAAFLSTPSARRATLGARPKITSQDISIHALREEGDRAVSWPASLMLVFLSTPSARRATCAMSRGQTWGAFLSTPSARRATGPTLHRARSSRYFYPRPPRGGRRRRVVIPADIYNISIHALREEGDQAPELGHPYGAISIHALREEGDRRIPFPDSGRAISIHALREEGDFILEETAMSKNLFLSTPSARRATRCMSRSALCSTYFYPRPPRGGRHFLFQLFGQAIHISIHALREEGD